jgi:hypothetical protein
LIVLNALQKACASTRAAQKTALAQGTGEPRPNFIAPPSGDAMEEKYGAALSSMRSTDRGRD